MLLRKILLIQLCLLPILGSANATDFDNVKITQSVTDYPMIINASDSESNPDSVIKPNTESPNNDDEFTFDSNMFRGTTINQDVIDRLSTKGTFEPGSYDVSIRINDQSSGQEKITIALVDNKAVVCMSESLLSKARFLPEYSKKANVLSQQQNCVQLSDIIPEAKVQLNSDLTLEFSAPQAFLKSNTIGSIEIHELNEGESVVFVNYTINQYHNQQTGSLSGSSDYTYLNLDGGINLGLWQYRQLSSYSNNTSRFDGQNSSSSNWNTISRYVQRALPIIQSTVVAGQTNTTGQFLSGLSYNGIELASDERMLPNSQQGYAPVVSGIAKTNALVEIRQNGAIIYQEMVPSGAFVIRDLNPTNFSGDLEVTVKEADGSTSRFTVPFSAVPDSIRPGNIKYSIAAGKTRDMIDDKYFLDSNLQYGINNYLTLGGGTRLAKDYQAGILSSVFTNELGAFGLNVTHSNANIGQGNRQQGWMTSFTYSKSLQPTNTNIALAGYRYSTEGYREFSDFINEQYNMNSDESYRWSSSTYLQQYRLMMTVSQPLQEYGNLSFSASTQEYRDNRPRDIQYQVSYNKMLPKGISMGLNVSRQRSSRFNANESNDANFSSKYNTLTMLSFNIPLGETRSSISTAATFDKESGNSYQTSLGGSIGELATPYNYSISANYDERGRQASYAGNLNKQYALGAATINGSQGKNYWQAGAGFTGAVVLHSGGVVAGPYLGDTFAIIEAQGAEGAKVYNGQGATINQFGYAIVPSLVPYRYNSIAINQEGMLDNNVDIDAGEQSIAPYAGAAIKVKFSTSQGYPLLLTLQLPDGSSVPMGALVLGNDEKQLGMVGQSNQAYLRAPESKGKVTIVWGQLDEQRCQAEYSLEASQLKLSLIKLAVPCL